MIIEIRRDPKSWTIYCPCGHRMFWADEHTDVDRCIAKTMPEVAWECPKCSQRVSTHDNEPTFDRHLILLRPDLPALA